MPRKRLIPTALLLSVALAFVGCQSQPAAPAPAPTQGTAKATSAPAQSAAAPTAAAAPTSAPAATAAPPETIKIGISVPLSGAAARIGQSIDRFIRMAIDDTNAKGGFKAGNKTYKFAAVTIDDKNSAEAAVEAANRLVLNEKVKYEMGTITTPTAGAQTVTEPNKVLLLAFAATDKSVGKDFPLTLQAGLGHNIMRSNAVFDWLAKERPNAKRIAEIQQDDATGHAIAAVTQQNAKERGMTVVTEEYYPADIKDFNPLVTRVLRQTPDAIDTSVGARGPFFLSMMKALSEQGFKGAVIGTSGDTAAMKEGASFINLFVAASLTDRHSPALTDLERELMQRFVDKYGEAALEPYTVDAYNMPLVLSQVIQQVGSADDTQKVAQAMQAGQWDTVWTQKWGKSTFLGAKTLGKPAVISQPMYLAKVENGKVETFSAMKSTMP